MLANPHILALDIVLAIALAAPLDDPARQECVIDRLLELRIDALLKELTEA